MSGLADALRPSYQQADDMRIFCIVTPRGNAWRLIWADSRGTVSQSIKPRTAHRMIRNLGA